ncbi:hypothetical protein [Promicromonospora soli]
MDTPSTNGLTRSCGSLTITVRYDGVEDVHQIGRRPRWSYQLDDASDAAREPVHGADLYLSPVAPNDAFEALRLLLSLLTAAGEAYDHAMRSPGSESENLSLFPAWVPEAASLNSDELTMLALELEPPEDEPDPELAYALQHETDTLEEAPWPPARWWDVVFLQGDEGHEVVDLIEEQGVDAAIEHLAQWDYAEETRNTALFHGHIYTDLPTNGGDHTASSGPYTLVWHPGLGHVNLLRDFTPADEKPAWWPDRTARLSPVVPANVDPEPPARRAVDRGPGGLAL